jgi:hypothetical protein
MDRGSCRWRGKGGVAGNLRFAGVLPLVCCIFVAAHGASFDCGTEACGLPGDGPFPNLVVGTVKRVADDTEAQTVFGWARKHGYWADLPEDPQRFAHTIQMMSIEIPGAQGPRALTLLMGREHYDAIKIATGDLVRYIPHETGRSAPGFEDRGANAYWELFGCIAVLCRSEDTSCPARYAPGVYRLSDGVQLASDLRTPVAGGVRVDPGTYMPMQRSDR